MSQGDITEPAPAAYVNGVAAELTANSGMRYS